MDKAWLYQQIFHDPGKGSTTTDDLLLRYVGPTAEWLMAQGWIDRFFFLRYAKGGYHLRYRVRLTGTVEDSTVERYLQSAAAHLEMETRVALAEYEPETEKYGGPAGMDLAEREFCASSRLALSCISRTLSRPNLRVIVAAFAFNTLLTVGNIHRSARAILLQSYVRYWHGICCELSGKDLPRRNLDPQLASWMKECFALQHGALSAIADLTGPMAVGWITSLKCDMAELDDLVREGQLTASREQILCNLAHTLNNRLGLTPFDEVLVADFLEVSSEQ